MQLDDLVGEGERGALQIVEAGRGFPVLKCGVLLVGHSDIFADALVRDDLIGRLAQNAGARDRELAHDRIQFALVADRAAEPAILFKIARRVRHHPENIGVAVLAEDFAGAFA